MSLTPTLTQEPPAPSPPTKLQNAPRGRQSPAESVETIDSADERLEQEIMAQLEAEAAAEEEAEMRHRQTMIEEASAQHAQEASLDDSLPLEASPNQSLSKEVVAEKDLSREEVEEEEVVLALPAHN